MRLYRAHRPPGSLNHELLWGAMGLALLGGAGFALLIVDSGLLPACHFHQLTGIPCISCGSTRALVALGELDLATALRLNTLSTAFWFGCVLYIPYALWVTLLNRKRIFVECSPRDLLFIRIAVPLVGIAQWIWLIIDGR